MFGADLKAKTKEVLGCGISANKLCFCGKRDIYNCCQVIFACLIILSVLSSDNTADNGACWSAGTTSQLLDCGYKLDNQLNLWLADATVITAERIHM